MVRNTGTVSRGIRCPIIKENDNLVDIVVDSAEFSIQDDKLELYYQLESDDQFTRLEINF